MGRPVETKSQRARRASAHRRSRISKGVEAVTEARKLGDKRGIAAILKARKIDTDPSTVSRRLAGGRTLQDVAIAKQNMTEGEEGALAVTVRDASDRRHPFRPRKILRLAMDIVKARRPDEPEPIFGKNWVSHFMARHNIKTYRSKKISNERSQSTNPHNVGEYFDELEDRQEDRQYKPEHKYGMDESPGFLGNGLSIVVAGPVERKAQYLERDGNRRSYTIVATICADGTADVAPWFIFKAKSIAKSWAENNTLEATIAVSDSGYMNSDLMLAWMTEFERQTRPEDTNQWRQLAYDLFKAHLDEAVIEYAWEHKIDCISYPTNATQIFQGLDVCIFGPFKRALDELKYTHEEETGTGLSYTALLRLIDIPWKEAFTYDNIVSAFRKTGLEPIDRTVVRADQMKNTAQTHVAGEEHYNPAVKAVLPLIQALKRCDDQSNIFTNPDDLPNPALWPVDVRTTVEQALEGIESSDMGWVLGASSEATSQAGVYTQAPGRLPSTPESVRSKERAARRAVNRDWEDPDYQRGYELMEEANRDLRKRLAEAVKTIDAQNANHALNQAAIVQQKRHLRTREERVKGPVTELTGTRGQFWANGPAMRRAVKVQNKAARDKERAKKRRQGVRDAKKRHQKAVDAIKAQRATWRKEERLRRAALIEGDQNVWLANRTPAQVARSQQAPRNPGRRRKESTPDDLQDPPMLEEDEDEGEDEGEEDEDEEDEGEGEDGFAEHLEQVGGQGDEDSMSEDD